MVFVLRLGGSFDDVTFALREEQRAKITFYLHLVCP
jgi:hypothetical protein